MEGGIPPGDRSKIEMDVSTTPEAVREGGLLIARKTNYSQGAECACFGLSIISFM